MLLHEGVEAYKKEGRQIHTALGRQTEAQDEVGYSSRFHIETPHCTLLSGISAAPSSRAFKAANVSMVLRS
jgi:hypothetical protein